MATYAIYAGKRIEDAVFVREGLSWAAAVFTIAWALWHRMWIVGVVAFAVILLANALPPSLEFFVDLAAALVFGVFGNDLREWSLARRGLRNIDVVEANDLETAELAFYASPRPTLVAPGVAPDMLGLFGTP
jgi:Protein of unknown function (DUF2628)